MKSLAAALLLSLAGSQTALAGAWTQAPDKWQLISTLGVSRSARSFDNGGVASVTDRSQREMAQTYTEYGWRDGITLFVQTESVYANTQTGSGLDNGVGGGARLRLYHDDDSVLSAEIGGRAAGSYNFSVSADSNQPGRDGEIRLLYGRGFVWRGMNGFLDAEIGRRFMAAPRPDEMPIDLTAGLWLDDRTMAMIQSFNLVEQGPARPPYGYFRSHKIELSAVRQLSGRYLVQLGAYFSPGGQNALDEQGLCLSLWTRF